MKKLFNKETEETKVNPEVEGTEGEVTEETPKKGIKAWFKRNGKKVAVVGGFTAAMIGAIALGRKTQIDAIEGLSDYVGGDETEEETEDYESEADSSEENSEE